MLLKVCGMKNWDNMRALESVNPDYMGLIFHKNSPRYVGDTGWAESIRELSFKKIGVFVNEDVSSILENVQHYGLAGIQLHGDESPEVCHLLKAHQLEVIKVFAVGDSLPIEEMCQYEGMVDFFLFDTLSEKRGGSGKKFDWVLLESYPFETPFFLSGGISPDDIAALHDLHHSHWVGLDINSKFEDAPGLKNIEMIQEFKDRFYAR